MQGLQLPGAALHLAPLSRTLGIAEGIETALAASELFDMPVWSCLSDSGLASFEPPEGVHEIVIFSDNDQNYAGQKAATTAAHRLSIKGFHVDVRVPPSQGDDWLDVLNGRTADQPPDDHLQRRYK
jgi:putative DNA primase/helicase